MIATAPSELREMPNEQYHAATEYISKTMLSVFADCPAKFDWIYNQGGEKPATDAMRLGSAAHMYALERDKFDSRYYTVPEGTIRNAKHAAYKEQLEIAGEREILTAKQMAQIEGMAASLLKSKKARLLLEGDVLIEKSIFWMDEEHQAPLRCRPDVIRVKNGIVVGLKTTASAEPEAFHRTAWDKLYDVSVAMECRGYEQAMGKPASEYVFLVIETEAPYIVEAYNCFEPFGDGGLTYFDVGEFRLRKLLKRYMECVRDNRWPSYTNNIEPMRVPAWQLKQLEID